MTQALSPVHANAAYEIVVENLRRALLLGRFLPGEKLPPERELALQLQVSRTTLREALRVLEGEGLIESKRGATGGILVKTPKLSKRESMAFLRSRINELRKLYEYREVIEVATVRLAAANRTIEQLDRIEAALVKMRVLTGNKQEEDTPMVIARFLAADAEFHSAIAAASGNDYLMCAVEDIRASKFLPVGAVFTKMDAKANAGHEDMLTALRARDADRAAQLMVEHIRGTFEGICKLVGATP